MKTFRTTTLLLSTVAAISLVTGCSSANDSSPTPPSPSAPVASYCDQLKTVLAAQPSSLTTPDGAAWIQSLAALGAQATQEGKTAAGTALTNFSALLQKVAAAGNKPPQDLIAQVKAAATDANTILIADCGVPTTAPSTSESSTPAPSNS